MTENMAAIVEAFRQLTICKNALTVFEATVIENNDGINVELTTTQINQLKQDFATARSACKAELDSVSAS